MNEALAAYRESVRSDVKYHLNTDPDLKTLVQLAKLSAVDIEGVYSFLQKDSEDKTPRLPNFVRHFSGMKLDLVLTRAHLTEHQENIENMRRNQIAFISTVTENFETSGMHPGKAVPWLTEIDQSIQTQIAAVDALIEKLRASLGPYFENQTQAWQEFVKTCESDKTFDADIFHALSDQDIRKIQKIAGGILTQDMLDDPDNKGDFESIVKLVNKLMKKSKDMSNAIRVANIFKILKSGSGFNAKIVEKITEYYKNAQEAQTKSLTTLAGLETELASVKQTLETSKKQVARTKLYTPPKDFSKNPLVIPSLPTTRPDQAAGA